MKSQFINDLSLNRRSALKASLVWGGGLAMGGAGLAGSATAKSKSGGKYYVVYRGHKFYDAAKTRAFVRTKVVVPSEKIDIALNYRLKKKGDEWKIYDVIVDEASLVDNYRYQFNSIITKNGYPDLVQRMTKKLNEIKAKRGKQGSAKSAS